MLPEEIEHILEKYSNLENTEINRLRITSEVSKYIHENYIDTNKIYNYKIQCTEENNIPGEKDYININVLYQDRKYLGIKCLDFRIKYVNIKQERKQKLEQIERSNL